jgi:hypothetical protein
MFALVILMAFAACNGKKGKDADQTKSKIQLKVEDYEKVKLTADISHLSENQKQMLILLIEASTIVDEIFWEQTCAKKDEYLKNIKDEFESKYFQINYGPWDRLGGNRSFIAGIDNKPLGAEFYPGDMTQAEYENFKDKDKFNPFTLLKRNDKGKLTSVPFHVAYKDKLLKVSELMKKAAELSDVESFKNFLMLRAEALLNDDFYRSEIAWMEMNDNLIDFIVGPIMDAEDQLFWTRNAYASLLLIKDSDYSEKMKKYALLLEYLQKSLPVPDKYKTEKPGSKSNIVVYDAVYYAGEVNAGSKLIAHNLPTDIKVLSEKGNRNLNFRNVQQAKFEKILVPISNILITKEQRNSIKFDAFFEYCLFFEVANGLGITKTINGNGTVKEALKEQYTIIEDCKANVLSMFFLTKLHDMGELGPDHNLESNYITFIVDLFRSVRFGAASSQGKANMITFYYFLESGALSRDNKTETYSVNLGKMRDAIFSLSEKILYIQGDGDYAAAKALVLEKGFIREELYHDLVHIAKSRVPKDIVFEQGVEALGL